MARTLRQPRGRAARLVAGSLAVVGAVLVAAAPAPSIEGPQPITALVSVGTAGPARFSNASPDGSRVGFYAGGLFIRAGDATTANGPGFTTTLIDGNGCCHAVSRNVTKFVATWSTRLVAADTDSAGDVYSWERGTPSLVSVGQYGSSRNIQSSFTGMSPDGAHIFFLTAEKLTSSDRDPGALDLYERYPSGLRVVSTGPTDDPTEEEWAPSYAGVSDDGSRVFFHTMARYVTGDQDSNVDVYMRASGTTSLVSTGPSPSGPSQSAFFDGAAGSATFFSTAESLVRADADGARDVYRRVGSATTRVSPGTGASAADFVASSADGDRVIFSTSEPLVPADTDTTSDLYWVRWLEDFGVWAGTKLLTPGTLKPVAVACTAADGTDVVFRTSERLVPGDDDSLDDVYRSDAGFVRLLSGSSAAADYAVHPRVECSADATRVAFSTKEALVNGDTDGGRTDVYLRMGTSTVRISRGPSGGNGSFDSALGGISANGQHVFFETEEKLVPGDKDAERDVYRSGF